MKFFALIALFGVATSIKIEQLSMGHDGEGAAAAAPAKDAAAAAPAKDAAAAAPAPPPTSSTGASEPRAANSPTASACACSSPHSSLCPLCFQWVFWHFLLQ